MFDNLYMSAKYVLGRHVQVVKHNLVVLLHETIKQSHASRIQRRVTLGKPLFRCWLVTEVKREGVAIVSNVVTLKPITLLLVGYAELVGILTLESHCLLIS